MQVRLTKKLAEVIDGIDLSDRRVGDVLNLPKHDAEVLLAEGWASPVEPAFGTGTNRADAHDRPPRSTKIADADRQCWARNRFSMKTVWCETVRYPMRS